jgi:hypothetical protein
VVVVSLLGWLPREQSEAIAALDITGFETIRGSQGAIVMEGLLVLIVEES